MKGQTVELVMELRCMNRTVVWQTGAMEWHNKIAWREKARADVGERQRERGRGR